MNENKNLLLKYLSMALTYGVVIKEDDDYESVLNTATLEEIMYGELEVKPYLRLLSNMTEEEKAELFQLMGNGTDIQRIDFYLSHHFDFMGLIPKGLAIEVKEGNNPYKN